MRLLAAPKLTRQTTFICGSASRSAAIRSLSTLQRSMVSSLQCGRYSMSARTWSTRSLPTRRLDRSTASSAAENVRPR